jgi:NADH dehydrogenase
MESQAAEKQSAVARTGVAKSRRGHELNGAGTRTKILILGGGFAGVTTARNLEKLFPENGDVGITLVSRDNFTLMTPLLFEAMAGSLELRHCSVPIRDFLRHTHFVEASVTDINLETRTVSARASDGEDYSLEYDQLVLAMGAKTNMRLIPGSEHAFTFKTLVDAVLVRNHLIEQFERADDETDASRKQKLLTFAVIGGGLVGVEVFGELTAFVDEILRYYPNIQREELRFELFQHGERILPEVSPQLAEYAARVLQKRAGVSIRTNSPVQRIEPGRVCLKQEAVPAGTIILAAGITPSPTVAALPVTKAKQGQITVNNTLQSKEHPEVWALGDCASIPSPDGGHYPYLAQHAIRAARRLASNVRAVLDGLRPEPFIYDTIGVMGSLGSFKGFGTVLGLRIRGFIAWWLRRSYYLLLMPGWSRRIRIVMDWTLSLLFRPDIVKVDLTTGDSEPEASLERGSARSAASGMVLKS